MPRAIVVVALSVAAVVAGGACLRVVDLTPARLIDDAPADGVPPDARIGSDGGTHDGGPVGDAALGNDGGVGGLDAGLGPDA